jgi:hypothetical protein
LSLQRRDLTEAPIDSGSTALSGYIREAASQRSVVALVHGHTHAGGGRSHVGTVPVFNPGPLKDGEYAILTLERSADEIQQPPPATAAADGGSGGGGAASAQEGGGLGGLKKEVRWRVREYEQRRLAGSLADATVAA